MTNLRANLDLAYPFRPPVSRHERRVRSRRRETVLWMIAAVALLGGSLSGAGYASHERAVIAMGVGR